MIIDRQSLRDSRAWIILSLALLLICTAWYFVYAARSPHRPSGGSLPGLVFASVGTGIIVFAWALSVRKWRRSARWGKTYSWLQGHVYLSIVSYPIILYHADFRWGGPLTSALMWAFTICYLSGILVLIVQQIVPRLLLEEVPLETIYDQIDHVSQKNLLAADELVEANATIVVTVPDLEEDGFAPVATMRAPSRDGASDLRKFYDQRIRPFLAQGRPASAPMAQEFLDLRRKLPDALQPILDALEGYTEERRQFALQKRMHHMLHGWLLLHVPSAWVMIVLIPLHAVMAIRYR